MRSWELYNDALFALQKKAMEYGLDATLDKSQYPFKTRFCYQDPAQVSLFNGRRTGTMVVEVRPDGSMVDLNLFGIAGRDINSLVKLSEKVVVLYLHALAEMNGVIPEEEQDE